MTNQPEFITGKNLSDAWRETLQKAVDNGRQLTPFVLTLRGFGESADFRKQLDEHLVRNGHQEVETVAATIFPDSLYTSTGYDRHALYTEYMKNLRRIQAIAQANRRGTYFQRLIAYKNPGNEPVNQLEKIITSLTVGNVKRRSKLQASIFDATQDHVDGVFQGFPCMQHITFYKSKSGGLILNSFYAMQYLYEKAYGNWLGLINLGKFIAREAGLEFQQLNLYAGIENLEVSKSNVRNLL